MQTFIKLFVQKKLYSPNTQDTAELSLSYEEQAVFSQAFIVRKQKLLDSIDYLDAIMQKEMFKDIKKKLGDDWDFQRDKEKNEFKYDDDSSDIDEQPEGEKSNDSLEKYR